MVSEKRIVVGTCGFPVSRKKVFSLIDVVEVQSTFYNPLSERQLRNIASSKPLSKKITIKAWQVITHPSSSPSWRKIRVKVPGKKENYGWLRPTEENFNALNLMIQQARRLGARFLVLQTPPSMPVTSELKNDVKKFITKSLQLSSKEKLNVGWEPRGKWVFEKDFLNKLCIMGLTVITDYLRNPPFYCDETRMLYTRLHGLDGRGEVNYKYKYSLMDLSRLLSIIKELINRGFKKIYVLFNNVFMLEDATVFIKMVGEHGL